MASTEGSDLTFPEANATRELNLGVPEEFPVDPVSSDVVAAKEKKAAEAKAKAKARLEAAAEAGRSDIGGTVMSTLLVTGVVLAAVGVAFFVTKKLRST